MASSETRAEKRRRQKRLRKEREKRKAMNVAQSTNRTGRWAWEKML